MEDGNVVIRFTMAPEHIQYCDWVEVRGYAVAEGPIGAITGKLVQHRKSVPMQEWSNRIAFKKGRWIRDLQKVADEASLVLEDPHFKDGQVMSKAAAEMP